MKRGAALLSTAALLATAPAQAAAPVQTITIVNQAHVRPQALGKVERAVVRQARALRHFWGTPLIRFGSGGWVVDLRRSAQPNCPSTQAGCHFVARYATCTVGELVGVCASEPVPGAVLGTYGGPAWSWSGTFSHEVMEMLADPSRWGREVCDPVDGGLYQARDGAMLADFVTPAYFRPGSRGPWDAMGLLRHARRPTARR